MDAMWLGGGVGWTWDLHYGATCKTLVLQVARIYSSSTFCSRTAINSQVLLQQV